ncbi:hypothetical protein NKG05_14645 [Oerskovia sp. M15]
MLPDSGSSAPGETLRWIYGGEAGDRWLDEGTGLDYPTMIRAAHRALGEAGALDDVRVVVLAVAVPDLQHERLLGGFVAQLFGDVPFAFAVSDQGSAGPFTALRLAHEQLVGTGARRRDGARAVHAADRRLTATRTRPGRRDRRRPRRGRAGGRRPGRPAGVRRPPGAGSLVATLDADGLPRQRAPTARTRRRTRRACGRSWPPDGRPGGRRGCPPRRRRGPGPALPLRAAAQPAGRRPAGARALETVGAA